jgi:DNA invertase Pin-like site-specific DNA recombinase
MASQTETLDATPSRAAAYARMSTDHQRYSIDNQLDALRVYAHDHRLEVVETYVDAGKSGLRIANRLGLRRLIEDVVGGRADFGVLLVYDVSRWGRFQDADESAHYEFLCRSNGVKVVYCGEPFENDGSLISTLVKSMKRAMAAEYSRELSAKVFTGQARLARLGFHQGSPAGYGLRRVMVDATGKAMQVMQTHEHKSLTTARVVLTPGPTIEVEVVRRIFEMFVSGLSYREITSRLTDGGDRRPTGRPWREYEIALMVRNPRYAGHSVFNRTSKRLGKGKVVNPPELNISVENAFEPVIDADLYERAQARVASFRPKRTDDQRPLYPGDRRLPSQRRPRPKSLAFEPQAPCRR